MAWSGKKRSGRQRASQPSERTLARVEAIKKSGERWLEAAGASSSSSSSEDSDDDSTHHVLSKTLSKYLQDFGECGGGQQGELPVSLLSSAPGSCLICLSGIRRSAAVWSCLQCYCSYHLECVQLWVRDGVTDQRGAVLSPELFPARPSSWSCPKCRRDYPQSACPTEYRCYCGKQLDPPVDAWLLPHSCGELCGRTLHSGCQHRCLSLCHPGPCPPCPKTVSVPCYCGRAQPLLKRCGAGGWSCQRLCRKELSCGLHVCEERCHADRCPPCSEVTEQPCVCGMESQRRPCAEGDWHCTQPCSKLLECGHHTCQRVCHSGECGACPASGERSCPCGKTKHLLPCTDEVPTCGDTCGHALECGRHECVRQCHRGSCGTCRQLTTKRCRCGRKEKATVCSQELLCETRCQKLRQCSRHQCRRKCCSGGECPPCEQRCSRTLACRNHKCPAPCHTGRCYPCEREVRVLCRCGAAGLSVPCGAEKAARPPRCRRPCQAPPICHHTRRKAHSCHFGVCPPCRLVCGARLPCGHNCLAVCHSEPVVLRPSQPSLGIPSQSQPSVVVQPCPPCSQLVEKACRGAHEVASMHCSEVREFSCGLKCGRSLACGNHTCQQECHVISGDVTEAGDECLPCERGCARGRACPHPCPLPCHSEPCPVCDVLCKLQCHCGTMALFVKCSEWSCADEERRVQLQTCNSQCVRLLECGHRCSKTCHPDACLPSQQCRRRLTVRCPCKRLKKEFRCSGRQGVSCDAECVRLAMEREAGLEREAEQRRLEEERERSGRLEALERQLQHPRRRRRRNKPDSQEEEEGGASFLQRYRLACMLVVVAVSLVAVSWCALY